MRLKKIEKGGRMNAIKSQAESYYKNLRDLSPEIKMELISRLSASIKDKSKTNEKMVDKLFGSFISDNTAEEIIEEIKRDRTINKERIEL